MQEDRSQDLPPNSAAPPPLGARGVRPRGEFIQDWCLQGGTGTASQLPLGGACFYMKVQLGVRRRTPENSE